MDTKPDIVAFNLLFTGYKKRFTHFAYTYVRDWNVAEDITAEAFLYYWENRETLAPGSNVPPYILAIIKHKCLNHLEHLAVKESVAERIKEHAGWELQTRIATLEACEPEELFNSEIQEIVGKTLCALSAQSRRVFTMSRYGNKSYKEIAAACNISVKAVEFHITKTLKALRKKLEDYFPK